MTCHFVIIPAQKHSVWKQKQWFFNFLRHLSEAPHRKRFSEESTKEASGHCSCLLWTPPQSIFLIEEDGEGSVFHGGEAIQFIFWRKISSRRAKIHYYFPALLILFFVSSRSIERTSHTYSLTSCVSISYDSNAIFGTWRTLFRWQILFIFA